MRIAFLFSVLFLSGCSGFPMPDPPLELSLRTLRIDPDSAGFEYEYQVCDKKNIFGGCKEAHWERDFFDLTDPVTRQKLINMGFVAKVRDKVLLP